jgi:hypothetical protein
MKELQLCNRCPNIAGMARSYGVIAAFPRSHSLHPVSIYSVFQRVDRDSRGAARLDCIPTQRVGTRHKTHPDNDMQFGICLNIFVLFVSFVDKLFFPKSYPCPCGKMDLK